MLSLTILLVTHMYPCWFSIKIKGTNFILKYAQVQKKTFERENTKTFLYFPFSLGWIFKIFFPIFENLSSAGLKNRKLNCSGLILKRKVLRASISYTHSWLAIGWEKQSLYQAISTLLLWLFCIKPFDHLSPTQTHHIIWWCCWILPGCILPVYSFLVNRLREFCVSSTLR